MRKEKTPEEKAAYEAKRAAQRRQWAIAHPEKTRAYGRAFYQRNREKRKASSNEYNHLHKAERSAYSHAYYRRKKAENPNYVREMNARRRARRLAAGWVPAPPRIPMTVEERKQARHRYYMENRVDLCRKKLTIYAYQSISEIRSRMPGRVEEYLRAYPFEVYGDKLISKILREFGIRRHEAVYADCYEAGMLAYLYSIHRCAALGCDYTIAYIRKMVRIYVGCALVVYHEVRELCHGNHFREVRLDADEAGRLY